MSNLSTEPRPAPVTDDEGLLTNPEGWTMVLIAADRETVVAGWAADGTFHQWETTETIVQQLVDALAALQQVLAEVTQ